MPQIPEKILCAAIWVDTGKEEDGARSKGYPVNGLVFCGLRHGDCIKLVHAWWENLSKEEQTQIEAINPPHPNGRLSYSRYA